MKIIDPLAQSFYVEPESGIFATSVDLYFYSRDTELPLTVQLRPMKLGVPTNEVYPFSEVIINPSNVNVSSDGSISTRVTFESPVYLKGGEFHAIVLISNSSDYNVWLSRLGEIDVKSASGPEARQIVVTKQPLSGSLFKSQNGLTWTSSDYDDLKFTLYRASFGISGNLNLYNPELSLGNDQIATLVKDPLEFSSKKIRVGLGTTLTTDSTKIPVFGNTIVQQGSNASGNYVGSAGSSFGSLSIINAGIGYTPSSGIFTFTSVALESVTGSGKNATANITIQNGVSIGATIIAGGTGYQVGDVLTATQIGLTSLGRNLRLSVGAISGINEFVIDQVQGDFEVGAAKTVQFINSLGIRTDLNGTGSGVLLTGIETISDGLHVKVNHKNHGMHSLLNSVTISNVLSDVKPTLLAANVDKGSTSSIIVQDVSNLSTFENVGVGTTNPGYIIIGNEIIAYEGVSGSSLTGITRSIDQTLSFSYATGTPVYKYEIGGVSLRRINKTHDIADATVSDTTDLDHYYLKIDTTSDGKTGSLPQGQVDRSVGTSFPKLYANQTKSTGGVQVKATQNIQYEIVTPTVQTMNLNGTNVKSSIRTVSATSADGTETSFVDQGFEDIDLNSSNYLSSARLIASKVNETNKLSTLPYNKSFTLNLNLSTTNTYISPVVDLDRIGLVLSTNRVNNPVSNYITDDRVATLNQDPSSFVYATNPISLENPASSIKVIATAYINIYNDIRAFYAITNNPQEEPIYYPFPGYLNLDSSKKIINIANSDGSPDKFLTKTDVIGFDATKLPYKDIEFTIDGLPSFRYFSIKLIATSTNQTYPPRLKDLRVIALA